MNRLLTAIGTERMKIRRSKLMRISLLTSIILPVIFALIFSGEIGTQKAFEGAVDFPGLLDQLGIVMSMGGLIGFGFVFSWIFGREYSDRTVKDLLALPLSRYGVAGAKLIVAAVWCAVLALMLYVVGSLAGALLQLDGWSIAVVVQSFDEFARITIMVICLCIPVGWIASVGRGYLTPLGFVVLTIIIAQLGGGLGITEYMPWAIPGLLSGASGETDLHLQAVSLMLPYVTGAIGIAGTLAWWRYADQT
ncbi:ABC transporter permease [Paenibacillus sp. 2TAB19]|uniref:ABC transporter permease n=1 Tax=Paenibacillus sp. 2TAB19 TaxID=3233003 RepID=UPI003F977C7D